MENPYSSHSTLQSKLQSAVGAFLGILITGLIFLFTSHVQPNQTWLMAPLGASALMLFTLPESPLAQPWSLIGGNLIAGFVGMTCLFLIDTPLLSASISIFACILLMYALRCLHPPSGAVAVMIAMGASGTRDLGYVFILHPLGTITLTLLLCAFVYNRATGQIYPVNVRENLNKQKELMEVKDIDTEAVALHSEQRTYAQRFEKLRCHQIMQSDIPTLKIDTPLDEAWQIILNRNIQALPVLGDRGELLGIVTRSDFIRQTEASTFDSFKTQLKNLLNRNPKNVKTKPGAVGQMMRTTGQIVRVESPVVDAVPLMLDQKMRHIAVVDEQGLFKGMINQTDMIAALFSATRSDF